MAGEVGVMAEDVRAIPDTPEAARIVLGDAAAIAAGTCTEGSGFDAAALAVARLVLSDPEGWREALGLDHLFLASDALSPDTRCGGCGVRLADVSDSDICPGVPS